MKFNFISTFAFLFLGILVFSSCGKENLDVTTVEEPEVTEVVNCDLQINIIEDGTSLVANLAGGTAPYTFLWSNGETAKSTTPNADGDYSVTVTDAQACEAMFTLTLSNASSCTTLAVQVDESGGTITAYPVGGTPPYTYLWSTGETTSSITPNIEGDFEVTVTDAAACVVTQTITIGGSNPCQGFAAEITVTPSGVLTVTLAGGTAPYTYLWSTGETGSSIITNADGTYSVSVTDAQGCVAWNSISVGNTDPCSSLDASINVDMGTLTVTVIGGTAPYTYLWSNGATGSSITPLTSGDYTVIITDANGCTLSITTAVVVNVPCNGFEVEILINGPTLIAQVTGGTGPYAYLWSTGAVTSTITVNASGTYEVTVTDATGCTASISVQI